MRPLSHGVSDLPRPELQRRFSAAFARSEAQILLLPTTPCPAPLIEQQTSFHIAGREVSDLALARHTLAASIAGLPGISMPMGRTRSGLPTGIELEAAFGRDAHLLEIAHRVEAVILAAR